MTDTAAKLAHLLPHWAEHNDAHVQTFRDWARRARGEGLDAVAAALDEAVQQVELATEALSRAAGALPPPSR